METKKGENSVLQLLKGYTKTEAVQIVEDLFKVKKQADRGLRHGYGGKKRGIGAEEDEDQQSPLKKRLNNGIMDSLKAHIHPFLEKRPPPKLKIMSFAEAIANLPNPKLNQKTRTKPIHRCPPPSHSRTTLPLTKVVVERRRPTKISASASKQSNTRSKSNSSKSKKETSHVPQIPRRISPDLHEHQAAPQLPAMPLQVSAASEQSPICFGKAGGSSILAEISPRAASKAQDHKRFGRASTNVKHKKEEAAAQPNHSHTSLPLSKAAGNGGRRPTKISASASDHSNTRNKSKPSISQKETSHVPQIPQRISPDLQEHRAAHKPPALLLQVSASDQSTICFGKADGSSIPDEISPRRAAHATVFISKPQDHKPFGEVSTNVKHKEEEAAAQLKSTRQREREAARLALDKVEEAADGRDNLQIFQEFQALCRCNLQKYPHGFYPLQQFGLILKQIM